jgi:hypothetical protein
VIYLPEEEINPNNWFLVVWNQNHFVSNKII